LRGSPGGEALLAVADAARLAHEAWQLAIAWRLQPRLRGATLNEDGKALLEWAPRYERALHRNGLIDAVAVMLELGVIDNTGRFADLANLAPAIAARITEAADQPAFILAAGKTPVMLTQKDIRQMQLGKAAIRAGIKLLQEKLGVEDAEIERIYLAGAFGNYIRPANAKRIGLLPNIPLERIQSIGNAAAVGAQMALVSSHCRKAAGELAKKIQYVEIAHEPRFQDVYADSMFF